MRTYNSCSLFIFLLSLLFVINSYSQEESKFANDKNKFFVGLDLSGAFPVGSFSNVDTHFPCNSTVSTGSVYDLTLGCRLSPKYGVLALLYDGSFELDPSSRGVAQLISSSNGLYENAQVLKNGAWVAQGINIGMYYSFPVGKTNKIFIRPRILLGITGCRLPEIVVVGTHNPTTANSSGNSIDTVETWDTPSAYAYTLTYRIGAGVNYVLNKKLDLFLTLDYQGSPLNFNNIPTNYSEVVNSTNITTGVVTPLSTSSILYEENVKINFQTLNLGIGILFRF